MKVALADLGRILTGNTPKKSDEKNYSSNDIYFIKPSDFVNDRITQLYDAEHFISHHAESSARVVPSGSVLVTCIGIIGKVAITKKKMAFNQQINAIIPVKNIVNEKFLAYALLNKQRILQEKANAPVVPIINKGDFSKLTIDIYELEKQRKICDRLEYLENIIKYRQEQLNLLDGLVKSRFVEMFGDPVCNSMNLPTMKGIDIFRLTNGKFVPESKRYELGIPAYGGNGISWYTDAALIQKDTIVIGRVGFQSGNVHFAKGPLWITDNAMYINNFNAEKYDLFFMYYLMRYIDFTRFQDAGDLKKITQKPFMNMKYIMPVLSRQREYVAFVKQTDKSRLAIQKSLDKTQLLFDSLMQKYFG